MIYSLYLYNSTPSTTGCKDGLVNILDCMDWLKTPLRVLAINIQCFALLQLYIGKDVECRNANKMEMN